jgi:hypothetical protein
MDIKNNCKISLRIVSLSMIHNFAEHGFYMLGNVSGMHFILIILVPNSFLRAHRWQASSGLWATTVPVNTEELKVFLLIICRILFCIHFRKICWRR